MVIKNAAQVGNPLIRARAREVSNFKIKSVQKTVDDLIDSMRYHDLVGLAAPQIGKSVRVFVTEIRHTKLRKNHGPENIDGLRVFINPKIKSVSKTEKKGWEGCGSVAFANLFGLVKRPASVIVRAHDRKGELFEIKAKNLLARVIQHEMDHLNGIVFTDHADTASYMSRDEYLKAHAKK